MNKLIPLAAVFAIAGSIFAHAPDASAQSSKEAELDRAQTLLAGCEERFIPAFLGLTRLEGIVGFNSQTKVNVSEVAKNMVLLNALESTAHHMQHTSEQSRVPMTVDRWQNYFCHAANFNSEEFVKAQMPDYHWIQNAKSMFAACPAKETKVFHALEQLNDSVGTKGAPRIPFGQMAQNAALLAAANRTTVVMARTEELSGAKPSDEVRQNYFCRSVEAKAEEVSVSLDYALKTTPPVSPT